MKHFHFQGLLRRDGSFAPAYVSVDAAGVIVRVDDAAPEGPIEEVAGYAVPGFQNAHSHAFQYAMAGLAEYLSAPEDDFWSWREAMYRLALNISPEQMQAVATMLYAEMLRMGYTSVAEFHYLHHDADGKPYGQPAEMGRRLMAAAQVTGMQLTLVPVYYNTGDFATPAFPKQRRFICQNTDHYLKLVEATRKVAGEFERVIVGQGVHSLRAASPEDVRTIFADRPEGLPCHIHIAEQQKEVEACRRVLGTRPVAWLADNVALDGNCHLVHATHLEEAEITTLARSGAVAVICPSTEGNLGDGFFPLRQYLAEGGRLSIGSDSHVGLSPTEELRWLDYGQRLGLQKRNVVCRNQGEDSGFELYARTLEGGSASTGQARAKWLEPGTHLDALVIDGSEPLMAHTSDARRMATLIYATDTRAYLGTLSGGRWVVRAGRHVLHETILADFVAATRSLRS